MCQKYSRKCECRLRLSWIFQLPKVLCCSRTGELLMLDLLNASSDLAFHACASSSGTISYHKMLGTGRSMSNWKSGDGKVEEGNRRRKQGKGDVRVVDEQSLWWIHPRSNLGTRGFVTSLYNLNAELKQSIRANLAAILFNKIALKTM